MTRGGTRHGRQQLLAEVGDAGQRRLGRGRVRLEGTGEILVLATEYLRRAGVGEAGSDVPRADVRVRCTTRPGTTRVTASASMVEVAAPDSDTVFAAALAAVEAIKLLLRIGRRASVDVVLERFDFRAGRLP